MTTWTSTQTRIIREAVELRPLKVLITIIAAPFWLVGLLIGAAWYVVALAWSAIWVGLTQVRPQLIKSKD